MTIALVEEWIQQGCYLLIEKSQICFDWPNQIDTNWGYHS